ncbi:MAG: helix-turn-helix domain-containing protein [Gracilimonas sp.]|uniref:helix-turn-helix domain-containing protein n=1 Tax=Gracilimonas TaxID=649462 RepID=UPI001B1DC8BF|nr:helix-turn-helix domain-containing protein [Gracilimonas sp.]MBO6584468.1 helix-turn-helix domain-containing protein [Gracilimonas sp.]MBO6616261.1 helix-turn-helix domain-containing protein [Gracilimonas sp.]
MNQEFLNKLESIIESNLDNDQFSVEDLAKAIGQSRSTLHRKISDLTGQSTSQFIREYRLQKAHELLLKQEGNVSEIAFKVGFNSSSYFSKCFHDYYGYPPNEIHSKSQKFVQENLDENLSTSINPEGKNKFRSSSRLLILSLVGFAVILLTFFSLNPIKTSSNPPSLAVLPLHNLTGETDQDYFVDGLHDAITGKLGQVSELRVISRTSTLRYRDTDTNITEIARELGVRNLIEGSVYKAGDSVRIQIQLIDVEPEEKHIWAKSYARNTANIFAMLSEVTVDIAEGVHVSLTPEQERQLAVPREVNPEAYKAYLRGNYYLNQYTPETYERGISYLLEATRIDPADPLPWARLALGYNIAGHGITPPEDAYKLAQAAADRALQIDSTLGEVHLAQALVDLYETWDWDATEEGFRKVFKYNPNIAEAYAHYSWFLDLIEADFQHVIDHQKIAVDLDPFTPLYSTYLSFIYSSYGKYDEAIKAAEKSLSINPDYAYAYHVLGLAYSGKEMHNKAIEAHKKSVQLNPRWTYALGAAYAVAGNEDKALSIADSLSMNPIPIETWGLAEIYATLGDYEKAFSWLDECYRIRFSWYPWINRNPRFNPLKKDPRFKIHLERLDLPEPEMLTLTQY